MLDVGAAQGFLGQLLQGTAIEIDGIEPQSEWAEKARPFYRAMHATFVEDAPIESNIYRVVVCADVLEHVQHPDRVLDELKKAATDDAMFIVSVPNVAHGAIRLMLLFGFFPKMERGVLDKTHLHFWTKDTSKDLLQNAGLEVLEIYPTGVPVDEVWKGSARVGEFLMRAQHLALAVFPRFFAHQWILVARRNS